MSRSHLCSVDPSNHPPGNVDAKRDDDDDSDDDGDDDVDDDGDYDGDDDDEHDDDGNGSKHESHPFEKFVKYKFC